MSLKKIVLGLSIAYLVSPLHSVDFSQKDKQLHFAGSLIGQSGLYYSAQLITNKPLLNTFISGGLMFGAGYVAELTPQNIYNPDDIKANLMGCVSGMIINYVADKYVFRREK